MRESTVKVINEKSQSVETAVYGKLYKLTSNEI